MDEYRNPMHSMETNLEYAIGAVEFREKTIQNLRRQIHNLRMTLSKYEDPNNTQFEHLKEKQ